MRRPILCAVLLSALAVSLAAQPVCTATKLNVDFVNADFNFIVPLYPQVVIVAVNDDCGRIVPASVFASFSNGDAPLLLYSDGGGVYAASYVTINDSVPQITVRVEAVLNNLRGSATRTLRTRGARLGQTGYSVRIGAGQNAVRDLEIRYGGPPAAYRIAATTTSGGSWLTVSLDSGTTSRTSPSLAILNVRAGSLSPGEYYGLVRVEFPGSQEPALLATVVLNVQPAGYPDAVPAISVPTPRKSRSATCEPQSLTPTIKLLDGLRSAVSWPAAIQVDIADDCGDKLPSTGIVNLSFSNGDAPLPMSAVADGRWTATWIPGRFAASTTISVQAAYATLEWTRPPLRGAAQMLAGMDDIAPAPIVNAFVNGASFTTTPGRSPGSLVSVFGDNLAASIRVAASTPLPDSLGDTSIIVGNKALPLVFASRQQANALVPWDLGVNQIHSAVVTNGFRVSAPMELVGAAADPAIYTVNGSGSGQGHIYKVLPTGALMLADATNRVAAGDVLVIYCAGLGAVDGPMGAGAAAPFDRLLNTRQKAAVTIGGVNASVLFSGLAPGFVGVYQLNVVVPNGVAPNASSPLIVTSGDMPSNTVTLGIR